MVVQRIPDSLLIETNDNEYKRKMSYVLERLYKTFYDVFKKELLKQLSSTRNYEHTINIDDVTFVNLNSYPLSFIHLTK